jgi:hypothetical protein
MAVAVMSAGSVSATVTKPEVGALPALLTVRL